MGFAENVSGEKICLVLICIFVIARPRLQRLTIPDIGVREAQIPQSLQGFFASLEAKNPFVLSQANRKNNTHECVL